MGASLGKSGVDFGRRKKSGMVFGECRELFWRVSGWSWEPFVVEKVLV